MVILLFSACSNNEDFVAFDTHKNAYTLPSELKSGIALNNNMLQFESQEKFERVCELLENETEEHWSKFLNNNDIADTDSLIDTGEFDPYLVCKTFEDFYSFGSLREASINAESKWLENSGEIIETNRPLLLPVSHELQPVTNTAGEYMVGNDIYKIQPNGIVYLIKNSDFTTLETIRNPIAKRMKSIALSDKAYIVANLNEYNTTKAITLRSEKWATNCGTGYFHYYANKRMIQARLSRRWTMFGGTIVQAAAYTAKYKRRKWRKNWWTQREIWINTRMYDGAADTQGQHITAYDKTSIGCDTRVNYRISEGYRFPKKGTLAGYYRKPGYSKKAIYWE